MKNYIYLVKCEYRHRSMFKVGFTADLNKRMTPYLSHNPGIEHISAVQVYGKTGRNLETTLHRELRNMGADFIGERNEWFIVEYDSPLYSLLQEQGLQAFKACKGRKDILR